MADVVDGKTRSRMMAAVRTKHTAPELRVRKYLHAVGLRYRLHVRALPGSPDIVLPKYRAVVFVHGCFWHQHAHCAKAKLPTTNQSFWSEKLSGNARRDRRTRQALRDTGWKPLIVWECETRNPQRLARLAEKIRRVIL
jgi:DNA mismatch endonuclease (patch repair protein)